MTYNHKPYILDALNGFAMQQTCFPLVALVMDDASTDGEPEVLRQYISEQCNASSMVKKETDLYELVEVNAKDNPNCHFAFYFLKENQFRTGKKKPIIAEWDSQAKYIAICEGDDYWTDPYKLQKQVDYMEKHEDCSLCYSKCNVCIMPSRKIVKDTLEDGVPQKLSFAELLYYDNPIQTPTTMYRPFPDMSSQRMCIGPIVTGDYVLWMLCAEHGYIWRLDDRTSVYRFGSGTWSNKGNSVCRQIMCCLTAFAKTRPVLRDAENVKKLDEQIIKYQKKLSLEIQKSVDKYQLSYEYKVGDVILKPIKWLHRLLKFLKKKI